MTGAMLRAMREQLGLSRATLATAIPGVSVRQIEKIENGGRVSREAWEAVELGLDV